MIAFQAPLWLLLLGLLPLVRWLHRFRFQYGILPSTTLFLWSRQQPAIAAGEKRAEPERRWLLRAAILALLILALAGPRLPGSASHAADVWVDDSLSMFTLEQEQTRMQTALLELQSYLREHRFSRIRLHSLGEPTAVLTLDADNRAAWTAELNAWAERPRAEPSPPPRSALARQHRHILLTDGADEILNRWARSAPLEHIVRAGELGSNLALSSIALRATLWDSQAIAATVRVDNLGDAAQALRLVVERHDTAIEAIDLNIPPLDSGVASFSITANDSDGLLEARLESSGDPLPLDDSLRLDTALLHSALAYRISGDCGSGLMSVLDSHPALRRTKGDADLSIYCGSGPRDPAPPALVLHPVADTLRSTQRAHWHRELTIGYLPIGAGVPYSNRAPPLSSGGDALLSADGRMLVARDPDAARVINVYLDASDTVFSRQPQYPLLILGLISELSGHQLDAAPAASRRDPSASRIRPLPLSVGEARHTPSVPDAIALRGPIIALLVLLLLADAIPALRAASGNSNW